jgi:hypothetical protein
LTVDIPHPAPIAIFPFRIRSPDKEGRSENGNLINHIDFQKQVKPKRELLKRLVFSVGAPVIWVQDSTKPCRTQNRSVATARQILRYISNAGYRLDSLFENVQDYKENNLEEFQIKANAPSLPTACNKRR